MDKVDGIQMGNANGISKKEQKKNTCQRLKSTVREMKNVLNGLANRQDMAEERLSKLDGIAIESLITKRQREQKETKRTEYPKSLG